MSYLVLARKYRPQTFDEVVGQAHVSRTLVNAIEAGRVAHAILFAGPRGTGKTTVARIVAKAMNCEQGPTASPCNTCRSCKEITGGHAADVFEIDGASNNSVDQVRELRENLKYMPAHSRYKIYIIDEVHMLSLAAFNALLKTLEEPPSHVLFMFATTEPHKIPITILSRCQRHDLRRIDTTAISDQMRRLCDAEGVTIDEASLALIAQEAGGSMRDGLSLLDHVLTCADGPVTSALVADLLGAADQNHLFDLSAAVLARDIQGVLEKIDTVWRLGLEMKRFYADLVVHFHRLLLVAMGERTGQLVDLPAQMVARLKAQSEPVPRPFLLQVLELLYQAEPSIKFSSQPRLAMEMVFLKLFQTPPALPIDTLIERLDQLRTAAGANRSSAPQAGDGGHRTRPPEKPLPAAAPRPEEETAPTASIRVADPSTPADEPSVSDSPQPVIIASSTAPADAEAGQAVPADAESLWEKAIERVAREKPSLAALLKRCHMICPSPTQLTVEVDGNEYAVNSIQKHRTFLEEMLSRLAGKTLVLEVVANTRDAGEKQKEKEESDRLKQNALGHPMVMEALSLFEGKVVDVKLT